MWTFTLPIDLPSANARIVNSRATGGQYRRARNRYAFALVVRATQLDVPRYPHAVYPAQENTAALQVPAVLRPPFRHVHLVRLWAARGRAWDSDNLPTAFKAFRDAFQAARVKVVKGRVPALVAGAGLVWDDSARWSRWTYGQERSADGRAAVRVTITDEAAP